MEPTEPHHEAALRGTLRALGAVAALAGARGVVRGAKEVAGAHAVPAEVDSEYRFYAAWYLATGLSVLRDTADHEATQRGARLLSAGLATAAAGRVLSLRQAGRPSRGQLVLLGAEVAIPAVLQPWSARVAAQRRAESH